MSECDQVLTVIVFGAIGGIIGAFIVLWFSHR